MKLEWIKLTKTVVKPVEVFFLYPWKFVENFAEKSRYVQYFYKIYCQILDLILKLIRKKNLTVKAIKLGEATNLLFI